MLKHLLKMKEPIIATKPLAEGRIIPKKAFDYNYDLR